MLLKTGIAENIIMHEDASKALHELQNSKMTELPELILLDVNMPRTNGFDFLALFDKLPEHVKDLIFIYVLTSSIHNDDRSELALYPYVRGILNKPLTPEILTEVAALL